MNFERGSPEYMAWLQSRADEMNRLIGAVPMTEAEAARAEESGQMIATFVPALSAARIASIFAPTASSFGATIVDAVASVKADLLR